ncbi:hypothetical protein [Pusillimonas noertemannii]|uniref:Uncharacterized protein n=1 Tax=Pusillimonas noertemannii TaxID=305977 RepID=A0A2U1CIP5_9BURK|nr:hypothetical protein [Pusillimonas noertemannii]NYT70695.1 hypothetical protein [Pusillimonas noertemannii]PVY60852.1 hypothetical protein C7440_3356 [Pusillimonas noertemannii]
MRLLLLLIVVVNLGLFAFGRGFFGVPPSEAGRAGTLFSPLNAERVVLGEPVLSAHDRS